MVAGSKATPVFVGVSVTEAAGTLVMVYWPASLVTSERVPSETVTPAIRFPALSVMVPLIA
jgi:hypothetical protein